MNAFALDKHQAKMFGVCAGLARTTGWDVGLIRIGAVLATLFVTPIFLAVYFITAAVAEAR